MENDQPTKPKRRGCLFYLAAGIAVVLLTLAIAALAGWLCVRHLVHSYTDPFPAELPIIQISDAQAEILNRRVGAFQQALRQQTPTPPLVLTADEINALLATNPAFKSARGRARVLIETNKPVAQLSLPLEMLGFNALKGRYLNATAILRIRLDRGMLEVYPEQIVARGRVLPGILMRLIRNRNLAEKINEDPRVSLALENLAKVEFARGTVVIEPKPVPANSR